MPRSLYGFRQEPLVPGTSAGLAARLDFASIRYIRAKLDSVFIIDIINLFFAKETDLALGNVSWPVPSSASSSSLVILCH